MTNPLISRMLRVQRVQQLLFYHFCLNKDRVSTFRLTLFTECELDGKSCIKRILLKFYLKKKLFFKKY